MGSKIQTGAKHSHYLQQDCQVITPKEVWRTLTLKQQQRIRRLMIHVCYQVSQEKQEVNQNEGN